ncbi:hypothetical protein BX616_011221 [Lobosporangium transversale]|nr:hypothetical protein BX616_011221 [Lobosporangium transversale]
MRIPSIHHSYISNIWPVYAPCMSPNELTLIARQQPACIPHFLLSLPDILLAYASYMLTFEYCQCTAYSPHIAPYMSSNVFISVSNIWPVYALCMSPNELTLIARQQPACIPHFLLSLPDILLAYASYMLTFEYCQCTAYSPHTAPYMSSNVFINVTKLLGSISNSIPI